MRDWPRHPVIYEINPFVWLREMAGRIRRAVTLGTVPSEEWDALSRLKLDAVWLMGVWERSPAGLAVALADRGLLAEFDRALPGWTKEDVTGSAYCIRRYAVDPCLGGPEGLAKARKALAERGIRLFLDFVPNHVARDNPWVSAHPDYFIRGTESDLEKDPRSFFKADEGVFACGRDPYFPAWADVAQVNAFHPGFRQASVETVRDIASQCDGMRCDMAMLLMTPVFERTWGSRAGTPPATEYWKELIGAVRETHPRVLFAAEAYWDLEWDLLQQGFDYCYDKRLYDRLVHEGADSVHGHLTAETGYQDGLLRFIENHDEPRAAASFQPGRARAAAVATLSQTGARLVYEGQLDGRRVQLPVDLARRPDEAPDADLRAFYERLLGGLQGGVFRTGDWQLGARSGWDGNDNWQNLVCWGWRGDGPERLVVVNLSDAPASGHVSLPWEDLTGREWQLDDSSSGAVYVRSGDDLRGGLYVALDSWGWHLFDLTALH
jgi:glycosidase